MAYAIMPWADVKPENREVHVEGSSQQRRPGRPARLSRAQILGAALELADRDGLEAVTMQRIARAIGAEPMSLYRHVRNKEDLLDGLVDLVFAEIELPSPEDPWKVAMRRRAVSVREALGRHPWAIGLMESRTHPGPATLAYHNALLANLIRPYRGFSNINQQTTEFEDTYHSIQSNFNRRFRNGFSFGVNYVLSLSFTGNTGLQKRLQHSADGSYSVRADQAIECVAAVGGVAGLQADLAQPAGHEPLRNVEVEDR